MDIVTVKLMLLFTVAMQQSIIFAGDRDQEIKRVSFDIYQRVAALTKPGNSFKATLDLSEKETLRNVIDFLHVSLGDEKGWQSDTRAVSDVADCMMATLQSGIKGMENEVRELRKTITDFSHDESKRTAENLECVTRSCSNALDARYAHLLSQLNDIIAQLYDALVGAADEITQAVAVETNRIRDGLVSNSSYITAEYSDSAAELQKVITSSIEDCLAKYQSLLLHFKEEVCTRKAFFRKAQDCMRGCVDEAWQSMHCSAQARCCLTHDALMEQGDYIVACVTKKITDETGGLARELQKALASAQAKYVQFEEKIHRQFMMLLEEHSCRMSQQHTEILLKIESTKTTLFKAIKEVESCLDELCVTFARLVFEVNAQYNANVTTFFRALTNVTSFIISVQEILIILVAINSQL